VGFRAFVFVAAVVFFSNLLNANKKEIGGGDFQHLNLIGSN